jgi:hypothetical protein
MPVQRNASVLACQTEKRTCSSVPCKAQLRYLPVHAESCSDIVSACFAAVLQGIAQAADGIQILDDKEGFGQHAVQQGDLVLVHYTGDRATNSCSQPP